MNKAILQAEFSDRSTPKWTCPHCCSGTLKIIDVDKNVQFRMEESCKHGWHEDQIDYEACEYQVHGFLTCSHCKGEVTFVGLGTVEQENSDGDGGYSGEYVSVYIPRYFYPAIPLIKLPESDVLPDKVAVLIHKAFELYWCDLSSCVSRLRSAVEHILDQQEIPRFTSPENGGTSKRLDLHARIRKFGDSGKHPDVPPLLEAVKWTGNAGTHELDTLTKGDALLTFEMVERVLEIIYPPSNQYELLLAAQAINRNKRPLGQ